MSGLGARMMLHLYDDMRIFVPAFISSNSSDDLVLEGDDILPITISRMLYAVEFFVMAISIPVTMLQNYYLSRSMFFHPNLTRIVQVFLSGYYFAIVCRVIIFLYQSNIIHYNENIASSKYTLIAASIIRLWFLTTALAMLGEIVVERQFAFYFVADYEENQRLWISTGIVILSRLLTLLFTFTVMTEIYPHTWAIGGGSISVVVLVVFATRMYRRNYSKLVELRSGVVNARSANTLCVKFQLIENVRVMKVVVVAFRIAGMLMAIGLLILSLAFYVFRKAFRKAQVCFALLDFLIALSAIGCISAFLLLIDECRRILRKTAILQMLFPAIASSVLTPCKKESIDNHRGASKQHFEHLKLAWQ